jgi:uncharacterized lipoprotein YmbA
MSIAKKWLFMAGVSALTLAGCGSPPPPQNFAPLDYSYLPPLVLKVANLNVVNNYVPTPSQATLIGQDPEPPATALLAMLNHRIVASGAPGNATVAVVSASLDGVGGNLTGTMTVDVTVTSPDGRSTGYTEATVSASKSAPDDSSQMPAALYGLTKQLMDNMNIQLQYQMQHNLSDWLSWSAPGAGPLAAPAGAIQATPLTAPGAAAPAAGAPAVVTPAPATGAAPLVAPHYLGTLPATPGTPGATPAPLIP